MMRRSLKTSLFVGSLVLLLLVAACVERVEDDESGPGDRPLPTPVPTEAETPEPTPEPTPGATETPEPTPEMTGTPEPDDPASWWEQLATDKTFPQEQTGDQILELVENQEDFEELWEWFELSESDQPDVDWDERAVLFVGTGESGSCPIVISEIEFDEDERLIQIGTERDVPADTMCTMDWTPRVFVLAFDAEYLGEGELRALLYDAEFDQEFDPDNSTVIREE